MIYDYPQTFVPQSLRSRAIALPLAEYFNFVVPVPCGDCRQYFLPFAEDDVFFFQFNDNVLSVVLKDELTDDVISPNGVSIDGKQFSIDFSQIDASVKCFYITVNGDCRLSHGYERATCRDTVLCEGIYLAGSKDLQGNRYSNSFSNRIRIYGQLEWVSEETEQETKNDRIVSTTARSVYQLRPSAMLKKESWALKRLLKTVLRADTVKITYQGIAYFYDSISETVDKGNDASFSWHPTITLRTKPEKLNFQC